MLEALKKKSFHVSLIVSIVIALIGVSLAVYNGPDAFSSLAGYKNFADLKPEEISNQMVEIDVTANFGYYMEEYSENTTTHYRTTTDLYYLIWTGDENATDYRYMTIKVPARFEDEMDEIAENTYNQVYSEPLHFVGKIQKLDSDELGYFEEFFISSGFTQEDIAAETLPYYIDVTGTSVAGSTNYGPLVLFGIGALLIIWAVYRIIKGARGGYMKKFRKAYEEAGYNDATIEADLANAFSCAKKNDVKVGRLCTYYNLNSQIPALIVNSRIMWAYQCTTTHRTNGVKTGTTYSVMVFVEGQKNAHSIGVPSEASAQEVLSKMNEMLPWVVVGHSDDLKRLFNKDRAQFLQLRYNTVEHIAVEPGFAAFNNTDSSSQQ